MFSGCEYLCLKPGLYGNLRSVSENLREINSIPFLLPKVSKVNPVQSYSKRYLFLSLRLTFPLPLAWDIRHMEAPFSSPNPYAFGEVPDRSESEQDGVELRPLNENLTVEKIQEMRRKRQSTKIMQNTLMYKAPRRQTDE
ncbi:hypothetical protein WR25_18635 [Diploscapter pachys]|uniref:Uncharacterized protein n=1 Tax=Diploscapter pachys TaxID=2018661 RepID=A0A2A2L4G3_9BILA|nr:hypothetical protein WR25_18635 [Diploscapter pachys]